VVFFIFSFRAKKAHHTEERGWGVIIINQGETKKVQRAKKAKKKAKVGKRTHNKRTKSRDKKKREKTN